MARYLVHPTRPQGFQFVANTEVVAALVECQNGAGNIQLLLPDIAAPLQSLFEEPLRNDEGQTLAPWSPQALDYLINTALPRKGWVAVAHS